MRHQIGLVDFADLIYVRSQHYAQRTGGSPEGDATAEGRPVLFGDGEGRIALANRGKDPLSLFNALHRHLGYPEVPRPAKPDESRHLVPLLQRRMEKLEARLKLVEEELKGGIDITDYYLDPGQAGAENRPE